jgi:glycogen debranching enzyme
VQPSRISILEGSTFVVSDNRGDINTSDDETAGLFYRDMRHLSQWELRLNGRELNVLSAETLDYDKAIFFLIEPTGTVYRSPHLSVIRRRHVGDGMQERLEMTNHGARALRLELSLLFGSDFADLFEVKDKLSKRGDFSRQVQADRVTLTYRRGDFHRETSVHAPGGFFTDGSLTFLINLDPHESWHGDLEVSVGTATRRTVPGHSHRPNLGNGLEEWVAAAPTLDADSDDLRRTYQRSLVDLAALRYYPDLEPRASLPAAGLPWFMSLFGRDSLIASYQTLPFVPELCRTTLHVLAGRQAIDFDDFRDAEPGKILHELRHGELMHLGERPQSPYYGSCDATPLFLIVLDEYERWTGDERTVRDLERPARAALRWMEEYGDSNHDGYLDYQTRNPSTGLANHCWKDSWNSIVWPDGRLTSLPRATCEIQGYAYDARLRTARLARRFWHDPALADRLERDAVALRERFLADFWLPDEGFYALAMDGDHRSVPTLASNIGHLLWSGIVPPEHLDPVVGHLMGPRLYSGWGVRTLAADQPAYNPMEYHCGTVWPHDTSLITAGLTRYGRRVEAGRLATSMLEAARHFDYRLPEVFVGYDRGDTGVPVAYPTACAPQAWASGAPLLLLRALLGLEPCGDRLGADPAVPAPIGDLALHGVPGRWGAVDVSARPV